MRRTLLLSAACAVIAACATGSEGGGAASASSSFVPQGTITSQFGNASFDASHVVGPKINASMRSDGSWGGTIGSETKALFHTYKDGTLSGPDLVLTISKAGNQLVITGQYLGRILRFEVTPTTLLVRTDVRSLNFGGDGAGNYRGATTVTFTGEAIALPPTVPFALALVATFL